jgi:hypothetical protein
MTIVELTRAGLALRARFLDRDACASSPLLFGIVQGGTFPSAERVTHEIGLTAMRLADSAS